METVFNLDIEFKKILVFVVVIVFIFFIVCFRFSMVFKIAVLSLFPNKGLNEK